MKKIFTLVFCVLAAFTANAQIEVLDNDKVIEDGNTIDVLAYEKNWGSPEEPFYMIEFEHDPFISNKGTNAVSVTLKVTKTDANDNLLWCLNNNCKPINGNSKTEIIKIEGGKQVSLALHPNEISYEIGKAKTISVKLEVTANGKTQKFTINYVYNPTPAAIESTNADQLSVANNQLSYRFSNIADRQLNIYGVSGRLVKSESLSQNGVVSLNGLHRGVYIYEILANDKRTAAHKFVVR